MDFDNREDIPKKISFKDLNQLEFFLWQKINSAEIDVNEISVVIWLPLINSNSNLFLPIINKINSIIRKITMSYLTEKKFMILELRNAIRNILSFSELKIVENKKIDDNIALIVASGASLFHHVEKIRSLKENITIFSLPSSLPYLYHANIEPDYAIAVDPGYATFYHISKYKNNLKLLTTLSITPSILKLKNIEPIFFNYGSDLENFIFKDKNIVTSYSEGSVIFNILNILEQLNYESVIIVGLDFSFKDNRSHIKEGYFEKELMAKSFYFKTLENHILSTIANKDRSQIRIKDKIFITDVALKTYYEHFLERKFNLNIMLFNDCYNPLSEEIEKIDYYDFREKYKNNIKKEISISTIKIPQNIKEKIKLYSKDIESKKLIKFFN